MVQRFLNDPSVGFEYEPFELARHVARQGFCMMHHEARKFGTKLQLAPATTRIFS